MTFCFVCIFVVLGHLSIERFSTESFLAIGSAPNGGLGLRGCGGSGLRLGIGVPALSGSVSGEKSVIPMGFVGCYFVLDFSGRVAELTNYTSCALCSFPPDQLSS